MTQMNVHHPPKEGQVGQWIAVAYQENWFPGEDFPYFEFWIRVFNIFKNLKSSKLNLEFSPGKYETNPINFFQA